MCLCVCERERERERESTGGGIDNRILLCLVSKAKIEFMSAFQHKEIKKVETNVYLQQ